MIYSGTKKKRPSQFEHFMNRAKVVAERSTCLRREIGAVIVKDGVEISSGYVGAPRGTDHCIDTGKCLRITLKVPSGERYELCRSTHAEQNAIINAARTGVVITDGEMYIWSKRIRSAYDQQKRGSKIYGPCMICKKEIINAGLIAVHMKEEGLGDKSYSVEELKLMLAQEENELMRAHRFTDSK